MPLSHNWITDLEDVTHFVAIFGHGYQPNNRGNPRKLYAYRNCRDKDAAPHRDWTEAAWAKDYDPLREARVMNDDGLLSRRVNAYAECGSWDFGGWTLEWMLKNHPETVEALVAADRASGQRFKIDGVPHFPAMCLMAIDHPIMPLLNDHDLYTQIYAAIAQFEKVFGRRPVGGWLPEAAVTDRVLEAVAAQGIEYLVLKKSQAAQFRKIGTEIWTPGGQLDDRKAYLVRLPSGKELVILFYNQKISDGMAFPPHHLAHSALALKAAMEEAHNNGNGELQLVFGASDLELWGLHEDLTHMCQAKLADECDRADSKVRLINLAAFIALCRKKKQLTHEVELVPFSSWTCSCPRGVLRWHGECPEAREGPDDKVHFLWRQPVRDAVDTKLRDPVYTWFESDHGGKRYFPDPWKARNAFIHYILARGKGDAMDRFLKENCHPNLSQFDALMAVILAEVMWDIMAAYTSCAWYFRTMGVEYGGNMQRAARAIIRLMLFGLDLEEAFVQKLRTAPDNVSPRSAADKWNAETRPFAVVCALRNLLDILEDCPHVELVNRATTLAGVVGTLTGYVPSWEIQQQVISVYARQRDTIFPTGPLKTAFGELSKRIGLAPEMLEDEYLRTTSEAALLA
jgi:hypothetical protein